MQGHGQQMHQNKSNQHNHTAPQMRRVSSSQQQHHHESLAPLQEYFKIKQEKRSACAKDPSMKIKGI
jgi:hypothetical protein